MAITSINGIDWNNLSSISGIAKASIVGINNVTPPTPGPTGPYKFYYMNIPTTYSGVSNTTSNTMLESILIPANTFDTGGILECIFRIRKIGSLAGYTWRIYSNTINSLTGATLLAENSATSAVNFLYNSTVRYFSLNQGTLKYLGTYSNQTDIGLGASSTSNLGSAVFNLGLDNYIILAVQPVSAVSDVIASDISFIRGYE